MGRIQIEIDEHQLKQLVIDYLENRLNVTIKDQFLSIEVKSKQNYKSEWEVAAFRARYSTTL